MVLRRATRTEQPPRGDFAPGPKQILVVNDDEDACELLCRLLVNAGHRVSRLQAGSVWTGHGGLDLAVASAALIVGPTSPR